MRSSIQILLFVYISLSTLFVQGQHLNKDFHKQRREELRKKMAPGSVAVFYSAEVKNRSNDVDYRFHQDPDFYYLTGHIEPGATLYVYRDSIFLDNNYTNEILIIKQKNAREELWNGPMLSKEEGTSKLGFKTVYYPKDFEASDAGDNNKILRKPVTPMSQRAKIEAMNELREIKTPLEIKMVSKAIDISCIGQIETMKALTPDMTEMEAQGIHEFVFKKYGCQEVGYPSIVGHGNNSCVLHYIKNDKDLKDGDLLLMDVGAEYEGYTADITRTIPVNGKFSKEQKTLYNIVKEAQEAGFKECKVGNEFRSPHLAAYEIIAKELIKLKIVNTKAEAQRYFPHGTSHYLGLDVHDRGTYGPFRHNTIITVEPGIYIPDGSPCDKKWWGIGIRIEDDILITNDGWTNLSKKAPRSIEEIEEMMKKSSALDDFALPKIP